MEESKKRRVAEAGLVQALRSIMEEECTEAYLDERVEQEVSEQISRHVVEILRSFEAARQYANQGLGKKYSLRIGIDASGIHKTGEARNSGGMEPLPSHIFGLIFYFCKNLRMFFRHKEDGKEIKLGDVIWELSIQKSSILHIASRAIRAERVARWEWKRGRGALLLKLKEMPNPHIVIVGSSGYGKSTMLGYIAKQ
ncbi:MAG: hypothetical protein QXN59_01400, partial [Candidatus Micrarchaeaceae archaeon]